MTSLIVLEIIVMVLTVISVITVIKLYRKNFGKRKKFQDKIVTPYYKDGEVHFKYVDRKEAHRHLDLS